jgi:hypothetical protein
MLARSLESEKEPLCGHAAGARTNRRARLDARLEAARAESDGQVREIRAAQNKLT